MKLLSIARLNLAGTIEQLGPWPMPRSLRNETHHNVDLLQCTRGQDTEDRPDVRYWTAYDHFMVEREARAARYAYLYGLIANAWRSLRRAASPPAQARTG